jgi:hypothetical protein
MEFAYCYSFVTAAGACLESRRDAEYARPEALLRSTETK